MARPLRIEFAGVLYHVTSRGDGREAIYLQDEDRQAWLEVLAEVCERLGHVFQGRYKAILVQREAYLLELSRYVVLNPVRGWAALFDDQPHHQSR